MTRKTVNTALPNSDDHLSVYYRQLSEHELLTSDNERELSQGIEDTEIMAWERVFSRPEVVRHVLGIIHHEVSFPKLAKSADNLMLKKTDKLLQKKHAKVAKTVAAELRAIDLDRLNIDKVFKELTNARKDALASKETWWAEGASKGAGTYLTSIHQACRDAANMRNEFVRANLRLVITMARRYDRGGMPLADLIQEGNLGLIHAVSRFDYRRGLRFSTYACWWIRHAIGRALADKARAVRIPVHMLEAQQQLEKLRQVMTGELGRPPTTSELAKAAKIPLAKLDQTHKYIMGQSISLNRPVLDDDDRNLGDTIADPTTEERTPVDDLTTSKLVAQAKKHLDQLTPIEIDVLSKRFGLVNDEEKTFKEIGDDHKLSRERIRQIQNTALDKLKRALEREHKGPVEI